ncbi:MAG TPA: orotidine-5'-phosphate decarboxylase [Erysipelotrichaceae bacterium]|nr:orotidine-5'-phosphate decarboxylase [Erysipelotrichaceae bacterium]
MSKPIIALDFSSRKAVEDFLERFENEELFVKIGMELYYQEGPSIVSFVKSKGHKIFLDLKLHDIPNTVENAMRGIAKLGVDMVNVHAAGGTQMIQAAKRGLIAGTSEGNTVPQLIAVTQLTSTTDESMKVEQLIPVSLIESVIHYAKIAYSAGADGVVCSALEVEALNTVLPKEFLKVTPGIRPISSDVNDQKRVTTPSLAKSYGSTHIVVGRPITQANDPKAAYDAIVKEWEM